MEPRIDRVVIASGEGLDQTVKMPAHTDAFFARFGAALRAANPGAATPDVPALMRRVHERLARQPVSVPLKDAAGASVTVALGAYEVQFLAASSIADPPGTVRLLKLYEAMDRGDFAPAAQILLSIGADTIKMRGMPEAMDIASGISDAQLAVVEKEAATSLLADLLNFPMPQLRGQLGVPDLGDAFRAPVTTAVPTLLVMGTLDGRTYLEAQPDNLRGFTSHHRLDVENAGHNVWMTSPEITPAVIAFLKGRKDLPERIVVPGPKW
jgi:pimeloyl-ACP methyl ester carboxylesterase